MANLFFTSDTHFNAQRTLDLSRRPFRDLKEMNETLVNNWNSVVKPDDIVFHLGDFGDYSYREYLNGEIVLVKGNYERHFKEEFEENKHLFKEYFEISHSICVPYGDSAYFINMTHEPHYVKNFEITDTHVNLFGHVHKLCMVKPYGFNVGTDCHNFTPVDFNTVLHFHGGILHFYDDDVFY